MGERQPAPEEGSVEVAKPQLLNADTDPVLRFPVSRWKISGILPRPSISYGWFDVSRDDILYTVVEPRDKLQDGFVVARSSVSDIDLSYGYLALKVAGGKEQINISYLPRDQWGSSPWRRDIKGAQYYSLRSNVVSNRVIRRAVLNFDRVLALVKPAPPAPTPETKPPPPAPPPAPPTIVLLEPSVVSPDQVLEVSQASFGIRGVAMDASGLPVVTINGTPANMKFKGTQAVEFWSDPLTLKAGENAFEVSAVNPAKGEAKLRFFARYSPPPPPSPPPAPAPSPKALSKTEILDLLSNYVPSARVAELVRERGVKFAPSDGDLKEIRHAGGGDELLEALKEAATKQQVPEEQR